jgi:hypothetical protein
MTTDVRTTVPFMSSLLGKDILSPLSTVLH